MVTRNRVDDLRRLTVLLGDLSAEHRVRTFLFVTDRFADVMEQRPATRQFDIEPQLRRHDSANIGGLTSMIQIVLTVARPVLQPA